MSRLFHLEVGGKFRVPVTCSSSAYTPTPKHAARRDTAHIHRCYNRDRHGQLSSQQRILYQDPADTPPAVRRDPAFAVLPGPRFVSTSRLEEVVLNRRESDH